jgi:hypothetical protein
MKKLLICANNEGMGRYLTVGRIYECDDSKYYQIGDTNLPLIERNVIFILNLNDNISGWMYNKQYGLRYFIEMPQK